MITLDELLLSIRETSKEQRPQLPATPPDLLLYAPCPVKLLIKEHIDGIIAGYADQGIRLSAHIPMGCTSIDPYDPICWEEDPERLPAVIASIGFGDFWRRPFVDRHVRTGLFAAAHPPLLHPLHEKAGLTDPRGAYTLYGVTPYVFLVDTHRLGGRPVPQSWEDLLHPRYEGEIIMCGDGDDMADAVILNIYKDFGREGLDALAANCKGMMHSSAMVKSLGATSHGTAAIFILPIFFAESKQQPGHIKVIWPADGAAASPLYFLAKKHAHSRLSRLIDFFTTGLASVESAVWFAPMSAAAPARLPSSAKLKWVGWEFIEDNDVNTLRDQLCGHFRDKLRSCQCD